MSDTPRTDGMTFNIIPVDSKHYSTDYCPDGTGIFVKADDARILEKQLIAMTARAEKSERKLAISVEALLDLNFTAFEALREIEECK